MYMKRLGTILYKAHTVLKTLCIDRDICIVTFLIYKF